MPAGKHIGGARRGLPLLIALILLAGCRPSPADEEYAARVGDEFLTESEVSAALTAVPPNVDPETARTQVIEQWVTSQLLAQEARRRGLLDDLDVQRQLRDNERNVLAAALLSTYYDEENATFGPAELDAYFERNRDRMRLREPYVRVRFVETESRDDAEAARAELTELYTGRFDGPERDSAFVETIRRFAIDTTAVLALAGSYVPQNRLARQTGGAPWGIVGQMGSRETSPIVVTPDSTFLVIQLVERIPAGGEPRLEWVADEVGRRLAIQTRQQMVAQEVQRLRTEAMARGELSIQSSPEDP